MCAIMTIPQLSIKIKSFILFICDVEYQNDDETYTNEIVKYKYKCELTLYEYKQLLFNDVVLLSSLNDEHPFINVYENNDFDCCETKINVMLIDEYNDNQLHDCIIIK